MGKIGLWNLSDIVLLIFFLTLFVFATYKLYHFQKDRKRYKIQAQLRAKNKRDEAIRAFYDASIQYKESIWFEPMWKQFCATNQSISYDPSDSTLTISQYNHIYNQYDEIIDKLNNFIHYKEVLSKTWKNQKQ